MKLIKSSFEILEQPTGEEGMYKQIEKVGRICWKSENKITEDSYKKFIEMLKNKQHFSVLEHGTVYLRYNFTTEYDSISMACYLWNKYRENPYSKAVQIQPGCGITEGFLGDIEGSVVITTNYRVLVENGWLDDLKYLCEPTEYHEKRITVKFTMDRIGSQSFCRHRVFSFAQESTRYCNYSKDKFGNEITCIIPSWLNIPEGIAYWHDGLGYRVGADPNNTDFDASLGYINISSNYDSILYAIENAEKSYFRLIKEEWKPQQARQVLPNALKTELVMSGFVTDWKHFFKLRDDKDHAHPDAYILAHPLHEEFIKRNLI